MIRVYAGSGSTSGVCVCVCVCVCCACACAWLGLFYVRLVEVGRGLTVYENQMNKG